MESWERFLVKNKYFFKSFYEMMENLWFEKIIPDAKSIDEAASVYYKFYTKQQEKEFWVVAIELEKINPKIKSEIKKNLLLEIFILQL